MKNFITGVFFILLWATLVVTMFVGIAWLFDCKPNNLYLVWRFLGSCLLVSFLFQLLFGAKIELR
jgi:hypothetical protein